MENFIFISTLIFIFTGTFGLLIYLYFSPTKKREILIESIEEHRKSQ